MKRFAWIALCLALIIALSACGKKPPEPVVSTPMSDVDNESSQSTTSSTTTATTGALVVTDAQGTAVTDADGSLVTTIVTALPTTIRPVTDPSGSTVTKVDGTQETEIVILPHITVATDVEGATCTSLVPEQTTLTTTTTTTTTEESSTSSTEESSASSTKESSASSTKESSTSSTEESSASSTKESSTSSTKESSTSSTEGSSTSSTEGSTSSSTEATGTNTTRPTQQEIVDAVSLPAKGYTPDNRIKLGSVTLSDRTVTMEIINNSAVWEPEEGKSYFEYTCYDKNNVKLKVDKIQFGFIAAKSSKICTFEIPKNTVMVELTDFKAEYWSKPV